MLTERAEVFVPDLLALGGDLSMEERKGFLEEAPEGLLRFVASVGAGAKVLPKCVPGPVSADGSGALRGSMRAAAPWR